MLHQTAYALVIVGALNWGLVALFNFNLVTAIFGTWPAIEKLVYVLVGVSALWEALIHMTYCMYCTGDKTKPMMSTASKKKRK